MPNGNHWKLDFQMFILPDAAASEESQRIRSMRGKIEQDFPLYTAITDISGDIVTYTMNSTYSTQEFENFFHHRRLLRLMIS